MSSQLLSSEVHRGLYDAWLLIFQATGTPYSSIRPEYVATVLVGKRLCEKLTHETRLRLKFEERAHHVATRCFRIPPFPRKKRKIPSRKIGGKGDRERIDITIYDESTTFASVAKHIVEIKISTCAAALRDDLLRNKRIMELMDPRTANQLQSACLGFTVIDDESIGKTASDSFRDDVKNRYQLFTEQHFSSDTYDILTSAETLSAAPEPEEIGGEFRHMVSVVITFVRRNST